MPSGECACAAVRAPSLCASSTAAVSSSRFSPWTPGLPGVEIAAGRHQLDDRGTRGDLGAHRGAQRHRPVGDQPVLRAVPAGDGDRTPGGGDPRAGDRACPHVRGVLQHEVIDRAEVAGSGDPGSQREQSVVQAGHRADEAAAVPVHVRERVRSQVEVDVAVDQPGQHVATVHVEGLARVVVRVELADRVAGEREGPERGVRPARGPRGPRRCEGPWGDRRGWARLPPARSSSCQQLIDHTVALDLLRFRSAVERDPERSRRLIEIEGKQVLTELAELVDARHAALVLVDMQRDFLEPDGAFGRLGVDLGMYPSMRSRLAGLLDAARAADVLVVHIQMSALPDRRSDSPAQLRFNLRMHASTRPGGSALRYTVPGTPGHEFVDELRPRDGELIVPKWRSSAFWGTNLDLLLRSNGIRTVIVTGCTTEGCVESTARDALFNDYYVVVVEDCVASDDRDQHDASLLLMRHRFDLAHTSEVTAVWHGGQEGRETTSARTGRGGGRRPDLSARARPGRFVICQRTAAGGVLIRMIASPVRHTAIAVCRRGDRKSASTMRASDRAYEQLRERLLDLRLSPGSVVNEQALANELGTGRMPVHEALARLASDGFVTVLPRRGTIVTSFTLEDVRNLFEAREALECGAVHIAAQRATDEDVARTRRAGRSRRRGPR